MSKRILVAFGLVLLAAAALWRFGLSTRWTQRLPPGWHWESNFIGINTYADPATGQFPESDVISIYERSVHLVPQGNRSGVVIAEDRYTVRDLTTGQPTWDYVYRASVDPTTGRHVEEPYHDDYFVFPRNVEKTTYQLRYSYLKGLPVAFQAEEEIEGVTTYLFEYKGRGEYTESYVGTADYSGITVEPGQEIKCADDQLFFKIWVEPVTGETLKVDESCYSGDYVYEIATGQALYPIVRWGGVTSGDDIILRAEHIRAERGRYLWASLYLPLLLLLAGLGLLGLGLVRRR